MTPDAVISKVCGYYQVTEAELMSRSQRASIVRARHVAMLILHEAGWTQKDIGELLNRDTSTVSTGVRSITDLCEIYDYIAREVDGLRT